MVNLGMGLFHTIRLTVLTLGPRVQSCFVVTLLDSGMIKQNDFGMKKSKNSADFQIYSGV
jgi:hypothetical protein